MFFRNKNDVSVFVRIVLRQMFQTKFFAGSEFYLNEINIFRLWVLHDEVRHSPNFLCNIGYADETALFQRLPRFDFDDVCKIV